MSLLSSSKCVLLLNDEGVSIYDAAAGRVVLVDMIPWETQDFEDSVSEVISKKLGGRKIIVFSDMVEQHYRKERVPRVSALDKASIIKRRVSAAFPSYPIRASLKLKEKAQVKDIDATPGDIYLFAALPNSENIRKILSAISRTYNSIGGFCLLPVESSSMVQELSKKTTKSGESAVWTVFVGQHKGGGLRQIVTKNGELALTRMTLVTDSRNNPELWASEVVGELRGTMGYLARFGFDQRDGLNVIIISEADTADNIRAKIDFDCNLNVMTAGEAAGLLKLRLGRNQEERYAEALHISWLARKTSVSMPLNVPELSKIGAPARGAMAVASILFLACFYAAYMAYATITALSESSEKLQQQSSQIASLRAEREAEVEKKKAVGIDFLLIERAGKYYQDLEAQNMLPLRVFDQIGRALGPDLHLKSLEVKPVLRDTNAQAESTQLDAEGNPITDASAAPPKQIFNIVLMLSFPPSLPVEEGVKQVTDLQNRIAANLPTHNVSIIKQVADLSYTGNFVSEDEAAKQGDKKNNYEAQILVSGELR